MGGVFRQGVTGKLGAGSGGSPFERPTAGEVEVTATVGGFVNSTVATMESSFDYFVGDQPLLAKMSPFLDFVLTPPLEDPAAFIQAEVIQLVQTGTLTLTYEYDSVGAPQDCNGDGLVDAQDLACVCGATHLRVDDVLAASGLTQGDLDGDGTVGASDFFVLLSSFGGPGSYTQGDLDCSGTVDFEDFVLLAANLDDATEAAVNVAEPATSLMLLAGLLSLRWRSRQRSRAVSTE